MSRHSALIAGILVVLFIAFASSRPTINSDIISSPAQAAAAAGATSDGGGAAAGNRDHGDLVKVDFYGESLCPDCQHMVRDVIQPIVDNGIAKLMQLRYIAFGNVRNLTGGGIACQHGARECKYNRYINCAQKQHPRFDDYWPYVKCMADHMNDLDSKADSCADGLGWKAADISGCAEGPAGEALEAAAARQTWALHPKHTSVPWIVVNGIAIASDFEKLDRYVCASSPSHKRPPACFELSPGEPKHFG